MNPTETTAPPDQLRMIAALRRAVAYPFPVSQVAVIETHISWVLLAGEHAFKVKKAVGLDFLDYCTLDDRRFFCEEELRLNRRTAPGIYLGVVPITGPADDARIDGPGAIIDYAVYMRRFDEDAVLSKLLDDAPQRGSRDAWPRRSRASTWRCQPYRKANATAGRKMSCRPAHRSARG